MTLYWSRFLLVAYVVVVLSHHHVVDSFNYLASISRSSSRSFPSPVGGCYKNPCVRNNDNNNNNNNNNLKIRAVNDQISSIEVDIYNEQGEELDIIQDISSLSENEIDMNYATTDDEFEEEDDTLKNNKKKIECSASIMLPFSADVAFTAFSDLTRQPSWCKYLHSVEYIGLVNEDYNNDVGENNVPLRSSKWTVGVKGLRFSWTASDTRIIRNKRIEWASNSGLKNVGSVVFTPSSASSDSTHMELCFTFILSRVVSSLYRRLNIRKYTEDVLLADMLQRFRDVVIEEDL